MDENIVSFLERYDVAKWLQVIPNYQQTMIATMFDNLGDYNKVAEEWLLIKNGSTAPFGAATPHFLSLDKILDEIELLLRGDSKYKNEITALLAEKNIVQYTIVSVLSQAIGNAVGTLSVCISPVIAICLFTILKMGANVWLKSREEERKNKGN